MLRNLLYFFHQSRGYRLHIVLCMLLGILNICFGFAFMYTSKVIVDVVTGSPIHWRWEYYLGERAHDMWSYVILLGVMLVLRIAASGLRQWVGVRTQQLLTNTMRQRLFSDILERPWHGREDRASGDIMSRVSEDLRVVVACIMIDIPAVVIASFQLFTAFYFVYKWYNDLLLILLCIVPFAIALSKLYYKRMRALTKQVRDEEADIQSHIQESILNRSLLLSLRKTGMMGERLTHYHSKLFSTYSKRLHFSIRTRLIVQTSFNIGYYTAFVYAAYGLLTGVVTYGMMTFLLQLVNQVQNPLLDLSSLFPSIVQALTAGERLQDLHPEQRLAIATAKPKLPEGVKEPLGLSLNNVSFRYPDGDHDVIHRFTYQFPSSSSTAIIGPTGSGKSTLLRLLLGLLQPTEGKILYLDAEGKEVEMTAEVPAYVPQGNSLLNGTIRDNLLLGNAHATEAEIRCALETSAATFVYDLPEGLNTLCGEKGGGLSEGQAQRIAIARALLQPSSILILDEASSALDTETEKYILTKLQQGEMGKTVIWVTHHEIVATYMQYTLNVTPL